MKKSEVRKIIKEELGSINEGVQRADFIADIFTRFLIGNRNAAMVGLKRSIKDEMGTMAEPGTKEYNDQYKNLQDGIAAVIKKYLYK